MTTPSAPSVALRYAAARVAAVKIPDPYNMTKAEFLNPRPPKARSGYQLLYHITSNDAARDIARNGLLTRYSKSPPKGTIWASTKPDAFYGSGGRSALITFQVPKRGTPADQDPYNGVEWDMGNSVVITRDTTPEDIVDIDLYYSTDLGGERLSWFRDSKYAETYWDEWFASRQKGKTASILALYHRTSPESAAEIYNSGKFDSKIKTSMGTEVYFSTKDRGQVSGYGSAVVAVRIPERYATLDDEFPDGEQHYWVAARDLRKHGELVKPTRTALPQRTAYASRVAARYRQAGLLAPPPAMTAAARYYFIARWGAGVLAEVKKKTRSQKARLRKVQKMLKEQKASIEGAEKALKAGQSFDLLVYHQPRSGSYTKINKRKLRYTPHEVTTTDWRGNPHTETKWEVDKPFEIHQIMFGNDAPDLNYLMDADQIGPNHLAWAIEDIETTLQGLTDFQQTIKQEISKRKSHANLLSAPNKDITECEMDLSGWTLWERRIPDPAEREIREEALNAKKTLKMKFDPQETGLGGPEGFSAYWSGHKWMVVFAGLSGYWSLKGLLGRQGRVDIYQFKKSLVELDRVVVHEMRHYTQSVLKELLDLPEIAGHPGLSDPSLADVGGILAGKEWATWDAQEQRWVDQRIPHELRDVEFETRLGDEIDRFERAVKDIDRVLERNAESRFDSRLSEGAVLRDFLDLFTARRQVKKPVGSFIEGWETSPWFAYLRQNDPKRYKAAVAKFTAEMDRRGFMKRIKTKFRIPVVEPDHKAWGVPVTGYLSEAIGWGNERSYEDEVRALREYERFVDDLDIGQLRRHRTLARENGGKEYWLTPRWQDHIEEPLSSEEMGARRTEAERIEHPRYR